jgi:HTH-type transcriptional regulator/antitoxin HigA
MPNRSGKDTLTPQPIRTAAQYRRALRQLDELMVPNPSRERGMMIDVLATLVQRYETSQGPAPRKLKPSEALAELLEAREIGQTELARSAGIPRSVISNILAGRRGVSKTNALRLADHFRVPVDVFLGEDQ